MDPPSKLPGAQAVANGCFQKYKAQVDPDAPAELQFDVEKLAEHLFRTGRFADIFINRLVPWPDFVRSPNPGHSAVADMIITRAARACLSANYDMLIERAAWQYGADIRTAVDGEHAHQVPDDVTLLLKFHGSSDDRRDLTVWTPLQFEEDDEVRARRDSNEQWIRDKLSDKDLLFVGFWSDWAYLNETLEGVMDATQPRSVTLVDPVDPEQLEEKARGLWQLAHGENVEFEHVPMKGAVFLSELRKALSATIFRQLFQLGADAMAEHRPGTEIDADWIVPPDLSDEDYYLWRRDVDGVSDGEPTMLLNPSLPHRSVGFMHLLLRAAGAVVEGRGYRLGDRRVRVVNGSGRLLSEASEVFAEPPAVPQPDIVVAVGAADLVVPHHQIRAADPVSVIRGGSRSKWRDFTTAAQELNL